MKKIVSVLVIILFFMSCKKEQEIIPNQFGQYHLRELKIMYLNDTIYYGPGNEFLFVSVKNNQIEKTIFKNTSVCTELISPYYKKERFNANIMCCLINDTFTTQYLSNTNPNYNYYFIFEKSNDLIVDSLINK